MIYATQTVNKIHILDESTVLISKMLKDTVKIQMNIRVR